MKNRFFRGFLTFSFVTLLLSALSAGISAKAAKAKKLEDYTDNYNIQYKEAVAVISALQVMEGYSQKSVDSADPLHPKETFSFRPKGTLTRGAAAKIIANLAITPEDNEWYKQVMQKKPFVDVSQEHVFGNYISYCLQRNLISGDKNHQFHPGDSLTYNAFLKMLLCVLGYDQYDQGYTGADWAKRVQTDAYNNGLLAGFSRDFVKSYGDHSIPREVAALFAFNALQANQVDYVNGVATPRIVALNLSRYTNIRDATMNNAEGKRVNQLVQFGEERFPDLRRKIVAGDNENVTVIWTYSVPVGDNHEDEWAWEGEYTSVAPREGNKQLWTMGRRYVGTEEFRGYTSANEFQDYDISFDTNDGRDAFQGTSKTVTNGGVYGELPLPDGVGFEGWFTQPKGGEPITSFSPVRLDGNIILYAHWASGNPQGYTVTFHADGLDASELPESITVSPDQQVRELPKPRLGSDDARQFLCWYYNGVPVSFPLTVRDNMDLYALLATPLSIDDFSYGFDNSAQGFGYAAGVDKKMQIPRYGLIFGDSALARQIYLYDIQQNGYEWKGNCYGMSTTVGMFQHPGNGVNIADFDEPERGLKKPSEITVPTESLKEFIEAMQVSQKTVSFVKTYWENAGALNKLCEEVTRVSENNDGAVVICIYNREAGHALLGYYLEERDSRTSRIRVYDSNFPGQTRYLILTKDNSGNHTNWYYDDAREYNTDIADDEQEGTLIRWGSGNDGTITYIPYEKYFHIWQRRGNQDTSMNLLTTNLTNLVIYDGDGKQIASFRNGEIENQDDIRRNGVYPLVDLEENPSNAPRPVAVWLSDASEYRVECVGTSPTERNVSLSNAERSVSITTTARAVTLSVDKIYNQPTDKAKTAQKKFILRAAVEGADDKFQIRVDGVSRPPRVDAPPSPDKSVTWFGSAHSKAEFTLHPLYDGTIDEQLNAITDGETDSLFVNGEDMTEHLKNAPDSVIKFDDVFG